MRGERRSREERGRKPSSFLLTLIRSSYGIDYKTVRIFAYSSKREQSNKRSGTRLKRESETGERRFFFLSTPRFTDFFTDFEKKTDCFAVYLWYDMTRVK